ncbi:hypothetical protein VOLCADRAFT_101034, partial [Volvox carteri f. nagariensis]
MQGYCICKHLQYASICNPDAPERVRTRTRATAPSGPQGPRLVASVTGSRPGLVGKSRSIGWFRSFAFSLARTLFTIRGRGFESHSASFELHTETRGCEDDRSRVRITGRTRVAGEDARTRGHQDVRTRGCKGTWTRERVGICPVRMQPERCRRKPTGRLSKWRWIEQQLQRDGQMHEPTRHLSKWWRTKQQLLLEQIRVTEQLDAAVKHNMPSCVCALLQRDEVCGTGTRLLMFGGRWQWRVQLKSSHGYQWQPHQGAEHHHCLSQLCCGASKKTWLNGHSTEKIGLTKRPGGRIPEAALARYDGGDVPEINQDGQHLEWPTVLEANILGLGHVQQQIYMLKVKNRPPDLQPITVTMHKIAMANPSLDQWVDTIPCPAVSLPENITVLCMDVVSSKEELLEKLKSTKVLSIRAANIVAWVNYLSNLTSERHIDDQAMKEWQAMDPECHKRTTHRRMLVSRSSEFWCLCPVRMQPERCRREPTGRLSKWRWIEQQLQRDGQMHEPTGHLSKWWRTEQQLLLGGHIPEAALARYDGGDVLEINQDGQHLEWPTVLEANILGLGHVQQQIYTLKVKNRPPDLQPITVTMHKIAMANPSLDQWVDTIPCSAVSLPENITVLCMDVVSSKEELLEKLKSTKVLSIRAANIVAWVNYLSNLTSERHIDDQAMKEWQAMDPECHKRTTHRRMLVSRSSEFWCLLSLTQLCRDQVMMHETRWSYTILDYSREDVLASNFPTAFLYTKGGIRPLGMSNRTFFQHVSTRVPQRQLSGNLLMLACMVDVLNMEDAKVQTWVTVKCCQQDIDTVGAIPREAVKVMADILALPKMHPDRRHLLQDMSPLVHTLITSLRAAAVVAAGQFLEFGEDGAPLWEERVMDKWWRVRNNPCTSQALLNTVKIAFMDILFGFKPGDKRQSNPDCFCGTVFHICICYMAAR